MSTENIDARIARLAARQFGLISRAQLQGMGAGPAIVQRRRESGRWQSLLPGVYVLAGHPASWRRDLMAALLACGGDAAVSHRAAAALWQLPDFSEGIVELSHPTFRARGGFRVHRVRTLPREDVTRIGSLTVTRPARTLIDLAAVVPASSVTTALDDALRRNLVTVPRLLRRIDALSGKGRKGIETIRTIARDRASMPTFPRSPLETDALSLIDEAGVPRPVPQYELFLGDRRVFLDFAWPAARVAVEADSFRWHSDRDAWASDLARRNAITATGWTVLHLTSRDVGERRSQTVAMLRRLLKG